MTYEISKEVREAINAGERALPGQEQLRNGIALEKGLQKVGKLFYGHNQGYKAL